MPRDKSKKFLKQKYAQQHKKTPARKHADEDDIGIPAPIHHLDDAVSKRRDKKNKYASQSHKNERIKSTEGDDEEENVQHNIDSSNNYPDDHDHNYTPLAMGTSTEEILQSFENDQPTRGNGYGYGKHNYSQSYDYSNHTASRYSGGAADDYNNIDINSVSRKQRGRTRSMHSLSSVHTSSLWPVAETESIDVSMNAMTGARSTAADDENETISDMGSTSISDITSQSEQLQEPLEQASAIQDMDTHLEALGSKDSIERIEALEKISHLLCRRFFDDYFSANMDKLSKCSEMLIQCLKKGDVAEQCLALQAIELLVTTVQNEMSLFAQEIRPILIKLILEAMNTRVQSMAISAFTYLVWLSDNTSHVQSTLHFLEKLWKAPMRNEAKPPASAGSLLPSEAVEEEKEEREEKGQASNGSHSNGHQEGTTGNSEDKEDEREDDNEKYFKKAVQKQSGNEEEENEQRSDLFSNVRFTKLLNANAKSKAVALQNWTWLISGLSVGGIASLLDTFEPELMPLLQANELSLRCASGEALTLLITNYKEAVTNQDMVEEFELQPVEWNHVVEAFIKLRDGTDKKRKASELRRQRRDFRDFVLSVTEDWKPEVTVRLQNTSIELKGWNECISYHRVKDIMGSGLQLHLMENDKLQNRLQIEVEELAPQKSKDEKEKKQKTFKRSARLQKESRKKQRHTKNAFRFEPADNETIKRK